MTSPDRSGGKPPAGTSDPIDLLMVTSEACHFCEAAQELIAALSDEYPIRLRAVDILAAEGHQIMRHNRVPFPPALLVAGEFHGYGRISERRLRRHLNDLVSTA